MKINLGCGDFYADGWVNVDIASNESVHPDVVADVTGELPFSDVKHLYAGHVLEHFPHDDVVEVLGRWRDMLADDGELVIVGPDCDRGEAMMQAGTLSPEEYEVLLHGENRWPGDVHLWRSTETEALALATKAGWDCGAVPVGSLFGTVYPLVSGIGWQFALICKKGDHEQGA